MAEQVLIAHTHAVDAQGRAQHFAPGDTVPAWARKQLTNPKLWAAKKADQTPPEAPVPARSGPGSGKEAWAAYAAAQGVEVPEGATRDDIMAACEAAGVIESED